MHIAVCVKQVPDSWAHKSLRGDTTVDRDGVDRVLNDLDEYAVEQALCLAEDSGGQVTVVTMGPEPAEEAVRKALQMGADQGMHICDDALHGSDAVATSAVLAAALTTVGADLVLFGIESTDAKMSVIPSMVAERLALPQLTAAQAVHVNVADRVVRIERRTAVGHDLVEAPMPVVVSVVEGINEPRYPSMKGIMAARKKEVRRMSLQDLGLSADTVGLAHAWSIVDSFAVRPPRAQGQVLVDDGHGGEQIARYLTEQKLL